MTVTCSACPDLVKSRSRVVPGELYGPPGNPEVLVVAESPGVEEDVTGRPLIGASGDEARRCLDINGISSKGVYLDNVVRCHPEGNRDPSSSEISSCTERHLIPTILRIQPKWIISMGRVSTRWFLGDVNMELVHGIPRVIDFMGLEIVVIPTYHPAAGLHDQSQMILFHKDMMVAGNVIKGKVRPNPPIDRFRGKEDYKEALSPDDLPEGDVLAIDTEWARGRPFCLSVSSTPGKAMVVRGGSKAVLDALNERVRSPHTTTVIHNAMYDLPVLDEMGVRPVKVADTMVMAYLLQDEPQGLKPLAARHCGMEMMSYSEVVEEAGKRIGMEYFEAIVSLEWPSPEPVLEWSKGVPRVRQPQNIKRKVKAALKRGANPVDAWKKMEGKEVVEEVLGPMPEGELCHIPWEEALFYSARDADATIRIYPILWERIVAMGLEGTFWRDMRAIPMVVDMANNGMPVDVKAFGLLGDYLQSRMDEIQARIQSSVGHLLGNKVVNPASYPQMSELIYDRLLLHRKGGKYKSKKGASNKSTANDILRRYVGLHPVVQDIMDWREYQKLKTSYADAIPRMVSPDGRIRTTLRITRTSTGRLSSSNPNLMAQPVRSEEGRKVRDCYVAGDGNVLVSGDYSQIEMRVTASESRDEVMMKVFLEGKDIHAQTASSMFGVPINQLDEMKHRYPAKRVGFGILNLITAQGLQRELAVGGAGDWSLSDCEDMIESWFKIYRGVAAYMKRNGLHARRYGYVRDMWGRIRYIPGIRSRNKWVRIEAERQAGNAPIQMGAQGVIKEAMGNLVPVYRRLSEEGTILPLIQIHDDIVWEMEETLVPVAIPQIRKVMTKVGKLRVPIEVDFKYGRRWGSMKKLSL